ncbi:MAG: diguanylate cyclase [Rhizobiaceae bacterium]|nr:diguanylate cyclase [Rhizobiaceae bacterium]
MPTPTEGFRELAEALSGIGRLVETLRERIRLLEGAIDNFPGGISLFDSEMKMVLCNERQKEMLDYPPSLFAHGNPTLEELFRFNAQRGEYGPGDWREQVARRVALLHERKPHAYERVRPNGTVLEIRGMPIDGGGFITTYFDVTEKRRTQNMVAHMAHHDALTDLPNRALFADRLGTAVALARRGGRMAVHYLDLDGFKPVNDRHGHKTGDSLLVAVAKRLGSSIRDNDTVARLGGDEFAILQTGIREPGDAAILARRILGQFSSPFDVEGRDLSVGVSIGIALAPEDGVKPDEVLAKADTALYRSKAAGRGRMSFFSAQAA